MNELVDPPQIEECQVQMKIELAGTYDMLSELSGLIVGVEIRTIRTYVAAAQRRER